MMMNYQPHHCYSGIQSLLAFTWRYLGGLLLYIELTWSIYAYMLFSSSARFSFFISHFSCKGFFYLYSPKQWWLGCNGPSFVGLHFLCIQFVDNNGIIGGKVSLKTASRFFFFFLLSIFNWETSLAALVYSPRIPCFHVLDLHTYSK